MENAAAVFERGSTGKGGAESSEDVDGLYKKIGELTVERDFLSRVLGK